MRKWILTGLVLFLTHPLLRAGTGLRAAVDAVLAHNAGLKAADAQVREAGAGRREAGMMRLPQLSARGQFTRSDHPVYVFGSLMEQGRFGPSNFAIDALNHPGDLSNIQSALDLRLPLFTGYELTSAARLAELSGQEAQRGRDGAALQLRLQTASLYLQLLFDRELLKVLEERLAASESEVADARKLKERGVVLGSDYYAAEAIFGGLQSWRIQIQSEQSSGQARLAILSGKSDWHPTETLPDPRSTLPSEDAFLKTALVKRPELLAASSQITRAEVNQTQAGRSLLPKVQAFASLETNTNDFSSNPTNHTFGVAASLPFGDPAYFAKRARSTAAREAATASEKNLEEQVRLEVSQAYEATQGSRAALPVAKGTEERAAKSLDLFRPMYRSGRQSIVDVLRAEEGLARAQAATLQTLLNCHLSDLQLLAAAGTLGDDAISELSRTLEARP